MRLTHYLVLATMFALLLSGCKDDTTPPSTEETIDNLATNMTVLQGAGVVYNDTLLAYNDTIRALDALGQWLVEQPEVDKAFYIGLNVINVYFTNGLRSSISIIPTDGNGQHHLRGGGGGDLKKFGNSIDIPIENEKVLVLTPYLNQFYGGTWGLESLFNNSPAGAPKPADITLINELDVKLSDLGRMDSAGFIILNTHGVPQGFQLKMTSVIPPTPIGHVWTAEQTLEMVATQNKIPLELVANGELEIATNIIRGGNTVPVAVQYAMVVTDQYIRNMNIDLTDAVVFGNYCFSGWTLNGPNLRNVPEAWSSLGAATYYGYAFASGSSVEVRNRFCREMEISLINRLVKENDSTGAAHLDNADNIQSYTITYKLDPVEITRARRLSIIEQPEFIKINEPILFKQFYSEFHKYESGCPDTIIDGRDGTVYKTVCIGDQIWMAENLNYDSPGSLCYQNDPANCAEYGRLYTYASLVADPINDVSQANPSGIRGQCPANWHIPSWSEWLQLFAHLGDDATAGLRLKANSGWASGGNGTDVFGFGVKPGGGVLKDVTYGDIFNNITNSGFFITTSYTEINGEDYVYGYEFEFDEDGFKLVQLPFDPSFGERGASCRCVRD